MREPINELTEAILGTTIEVHKELGPGLLESTYEACLCVELQQRNLNFTRQVELPVQYKGLQLDAGYRLDIVVESSVVLEIKSVSTIEPVHEAQLLTYLKLSGLEYGLLLNFNVPVMKQGIKRKVMTRT